jgi:hypothetical protein
MLDCSREVLNPSLKILPRSLEILTSSRKIPGRSREILRAGKQSQAAVFEPFKPFCGYRC